MTGMDCHPCPSILARQKGPRRFLCGGISIADELLHWAINPRESSAMRIQYVIIVFLLVAHCVLAARPARAEGGERKTLMQWSYGTSFEGGPDVYEPLVTDRPDFTEASVTVGRGVAQLESGYTLTYNSDAGERTTTHSFPETLLRLGMLAEWFEVRVVWNYAAEENEIGGFEDNVSGAEDMTLGVKLALTPQECILPETAIILQTTVPSGSSNFTADEMLPGFNYLYGWDLSDEWSMGGSTGLNGAIDDVTADSYAEFSQSFTVNRSWSDSVTSFTEWFVIAPTSADTNRTQNYLDGGFSVLINNDVQWDIRAGVGLNEAADDFFAGSGLSLRYW
jgi:hypothetical protein